MTYISTILKHPGDMLQLISLETAKEFMEQELKVPVTEISDLNKSQGMEYEYYYCPDGGYGEELLDHDYGVATRIEQHGWTIYPAFPQEQLKKYLRDTYRIIVESDYYTGFNGPRFFYNIFLLSDNHYHFEQEESDTFTYEEALELGLREGIKLINK